MRFYPEPNIDFYIEKPDTWGLYCKYGPDKSWKPYRPTTTNVIRYWRDLEGAKMDVIKNSDLYFDEWSYSRIRFEACLPLLYASGHRFILIEQGEPAGFKCAPLPVGLDEARTIKKEQARLNKLKKKGKKGKKDKKAKKAKK